MTKRRCASVASAQRRFVGLSSLSNHIHLIGPSRHGSPNRRGGRSGLVGLAGLALVSLGMSGCAPIPLAVAGRAATGQEAYVCTGAYDDQPGESVAAVNLLDDTPDTPIQVGSLPSALAATPDGTTLLVTLQGADQLVLVDTATDRVRARIPVGLEPDAVAVSPNGRLAVVANLGDNTITPVDLATRHAEAPIAVGHQPDAVAVGGANGSLALVANLGDNTVTPVDLATRRAGSPIPVGSEPDAIVISEATHEAVVANLGDNNVTPIDLSTMQAAAAVGLGVAPTGMALVAGTGSDPPVAWVAGGASLVPVTVGTWVVGSPTPVGRPAEAVAVAPGGITGWVATEDGYVVAVALGSGPLNAVKVGGRPSAIVIPPPRA